MSYGQHMHIMYSTGVKKRAWYGLCTNQVHEYFAGKQFYPVSRVVLHRKYCYRTFEWIYERKRAEKTTPMNERPEMASVVPAFALSEAAAPVPERVAVPVGLPLVPEPEPVGADAGALDSPLAVGSAA